MLTMRDVGVADQACSDTVMAGSDCLTESGNSSIINMRAGWGSAATEVALATFGGAGCTDATDALGTGFAGAAFDDGFGKGSGGAGVLGIAGSGFGAEGCLSACGAVATVAATI